MKNSQGENNKNNNNTKNKNKNKKKMIWDDWVGKVIQRELSKKFEFDHTNKWYMHSPEPVLENETHKIH